MIRYHAAERLALDLLLSPDAAEDDALQAWYTDYATKYKREPESGEREAAADVLRRRLAGEAPPLPASTSGAWPRLPKLLFLATDGEG